MDERIAKQIKNALSIIVIIAVCVVLKITASVSINIILSVFIFLLFLPLATSLDKGGVPKWVTTLIVILLIIVVISIALLFFVYAVDLLIKEVPSYSDKANEVEALLISFLRRFVDLPDDFSFIVNIDWIGTIVMPALRVASSSILDIIKNGFVTLIMAIFLLLERHTIVPKFQQAAQPENKHRVPVIWERINHQISKYVILKLGISAATGLLFFLISYWVNLDFAAIWGVLAFILNFIPTFGSIIITILTIAMAILQFIPHWTPIFIVALGTIGTQMVLGNIIDPRLQGNQLNLSPFVILVALSVFGYIFGVAGMFLAVPLLSIIEIILANMEGTRSIALILSSSKSMRKHKKSEETRGAQPNLFEDIFMP